MPSVCFDGNSAHPARNRRGTSDIPTEMAVQYVSRIRLCNSTSYCMVRLPRRPHTKIRRTSCTSTESKLGTHVTAECLGPYWTLHKPAGLKCVASGLKTAAEWPNAASKQGWGIAAHIASQATPQLQVIEKEYVNNRTCFDAALLLKPFSHQSADANGLHSITSHAKHP
jgi:hypothetical protein